MQQLPKPFKIDGDTVSPTPVFNAYWAFAAERQNIFFRKINGANSVILTDDTVLQTHKFTNSYRASDRVSQFLIKEVLYDQDADQDWAETFFRALIFKIFNKIETWELLRSSIGPISLGTYNYEDFNNTLIQAMRSGRRIYSAAYIMPSAGRVFGQKMKHQNHLKLIEFMIEKKFPERIAEAQSMAEAYEIMKSAPSIGPFLAYQFVTDLNYSMLTDFSEMEFVVAGPGALDGISKCFENGHRLEPTQVIRYMAETQEKWFEHFGLGFQSLWGRPLQLIDCQNLFCEISKFARVAFPEVEGIAGRTRIKQKYVPLGRPPVPWYPPKWGLNDKIKAKFAQSPAASDMASAVQYKLL